MDPGDSPLRDVEPESRPPGSHARCQFPDTRDIEDGDEALLPDEHEGHRKTLRFRRIRVRSQKRPSRFIVDDDSSFLRISKPTENVLRGITDSTDLKGRVEHFRHPKSQGAFPKSFIPRDDDDRIEVVTHSVSNHGHPIREPLLREERWVVFRNPPGGHPDAPTELHGPHQWGVRHSSGPETGGGIGERCRGHGAGCSATHAGHWLIKSRSLAVFAHPAPHFEHRR